MTTKEIVIDNVERQKKYVAEQQKSAPGMGLVFADAFLRGMRDIGYKSPGWALSELVDNSFQAGAKKVSIGFGFGKKNTTKTKPDHVAIADDGNGMIPEMIGYAVRWGGTDRENDRSGFGRYGYGLPSAAVSMAKRYTVYSKTVESDWHAVTVDIEELATAASSLDKTAELLGAIPKAPPSWVAEATKEVDVKHMASGTVIVLEDLDRLRETTGWITISQGLQPKLLKHLGVVYRHLIPALKIFVAGAEVKPVDPLFLMEHAQFYDENPVMAQRVETRTIQVETASGKSGMVRVRAAYLPPGFGSLDHTKYGRGKNNSRFAVLKDYNGILICRSGRQVDCIQPWWMKFQNEDVYTKVEVDFDPDLDEYFGITTAKQQIVVADDFQQVLAGSGKAQAGLKDLVADIKKQFKNARDKFDAQQEKEKAGEPRASEEAMAATAKYKEKATEPTPEEKEKAEQRVQEAARERAKSTGESHEEARKAVEEQTKQQGWKVDFEAVPEGPFYRPTRLGEQRCLIINTDHPFYSRVHQAATNAAPAIEILLFALAERELEASTEFKEFYSYERQRWSERLRHALKHWKPDSTLEDLKSSAAEELLSGAA